MIRHYVPQSLLEALRFLRDSDCYIMSGGTDLMVQKHVSKELLPNFDRDVLYVMGIKELDYIKKDEEGKIHIGATTRFVEIENSPLVPEIYKKVIREIASPNIRNMATMAGNIANASPAGDSIVPLVIDNAEVVLASLKGERVVLVKDFILGVRKTDLKGDEMIKEIIIKPQELTYFYKKVGSRKAESITKISFMGAYRIENNIIRDLRIAFGSVNVKVSRNLDLESRIKGQDIKILDKERMINAFMKLVVPITDQRSTKEYRYKVARNILVKFVDEMLKEK